MTRRFRVHEVRQVTDLRGVWDFAFLGDVDPDRVKLDAIPYGDRMAVPGCFDATPAYAGQRGLVAYRTQVPVAAPGHYRLWLDGVHHWGRVFVNGRAVRDHAGGFVRLAADLPALPAGEAEIVVLVDNRFDAARSPLHQSYFDWYHYGGIARGAELHRLPPVWIEELRAVTTDVAAQEVALTIRYGAEAPARVPLRVSFNGAVVLEETVEVRGAGEVVRALRFPDAALWSPEEPNLHLLHVCLGEDDMRERIGLRQVRTEGQAILVNGRPVRLLGFNRHEGHPETGHALPEVMLVADAQLLRHLGANFVRGSHYPQDPLWLDLCDEVGLMVWSEATGWQHRAKHLTDPHFVEAQLAHLEEMLAQSANHPSVIMWGFLNESGSNDPACRPAYEALAARCRERDPSRLVTYASCFPFEDVCYDLADVISVNCYPGWYHESAAGLPGWLDKVAAHVDAQGCAERPLMISEIGAGALWGWRDWHAQRWSEQYQAEVLERTIRHLFLDRDRWCGLAIWQFCDVRTSEEVSRILGRPRGFNNKGIVDEYRRPKLAYDVVRRLYSALGG